MSKLGHEQSQGYVSLVDDQPSRSQHSMAWLNLPALSILALVLIQLAMTVYVVLTQE